VTCCAPKYTSRQLREVVTFERATRVSDGAGGFSETWATISGAPTRAMVRPLSGRERWASERTEATSNYRVVVRYTSDLTERDRVLIRGIAGNIVFIANVDMADEWLEIDVNLGVAT
jgi:SPP1 family predicted phage head-tail adaptor